MEPSNRTRSPVARAILIAVLLAGTTISAAVVVEALRFGVPLRWYLGRTGWGMALAGAAAAAVLGAGLLLRGLFRRNAFRSGIADRTALRVFFYVLVLHAVFVLVFLQPFRRQILDLSAAWAFGAFALVATFGGSAGRILPRGALRALDLVLMNVCVVLVGGELVLRGLALVQPSPIFARGLDRAEANLRLNRLEPGAVRYGFRCNSGGYYDTEFTPKRPGVPLVVAIGDSFSASVVPHYHHFTTVCERALPGVDVYNLGAPSIGPAEYLYLLRYEAVPLEPDLIVVNLFIGNDIGARRLPELRDRRLRSWYDADNLLLYVVPKRLAAVARERRALAQGDGQAGSPPESERDEKSAAKQEAAVLAGTPEEIEAAFPWVVDWRKESPAMSWETLLRNESGGATDSCGRAFDPYPRLFSVIDEMKAAAGRIPLAFLLFPSRFQVDDDVMAEVAKTVPEAAADRDYPQRRIAEGLAERGIPYLDLLPPLRAAAPLADGRRHVYHTNDTHFNTRGNAIVGEAMAEFVGRLLQSGM